MVTRIRKRSEKTGTPPGTLVPIGIVRSKTTQITLIVYDKRDFHEFQIETLDNLKLEEVPVVNWILVEGLGDIKKIENLGEYFKLHPLALEDIISLDQRPKIEDFEQYIVILVKQVIFEPKNKKLEMQQLGLIIGKNYVISFNEISAKILDSIRLRLQKKKGRIRSAGAGYLAYEILDQIIDNYFNVLEQLELEIEHYEEELVEEPNQEILHNIYSLKREILEFRRAIWPLREILRQLEREEFPLLQEVKGAYIRDAYENTLQILETVETYFDRISGMIDAYLTNTSNRLNEVMKVLTIIATIFIPLTLVTGIFGMNFEFPPYLNSTWGWTLCFLLMGLMTLIMLIYFRKKKWL
ncbi:MAG: magnesium/cobalt transporter CorA [Candidatus Odinarchaeota archaeon]